MIRIGTWSEVSTFSKKMWLTSAWYLNFSLHMGHLNTTMGLPKVQIDIQKLCTGKGAPNVSSWGVDFDSCWIFSDKMVTVYYLKSSCFDDCWDQFSSGGTGFYWLQWNATTRNSIVHGSQAWAASSCSSCSICASCSICEWWNSDIQTFISGRIPKANESAQAESKPSKPSKVSKPSASSQVDAAGSSKRFFSSFRCAKDIVWKTDGRAAVGKTGGVSGNVGGVILGFLRYFYDFFGQKNTATFFVHDARWKNWKKKAQKRAQMDIWKVKTWKKKLKRWRCLRRFNNWHVWIKETCWLEHS